MAAAAPHARRASNGPGWIARLGLALRQWLGRGGAEPAAEPEPTRAGRPAAPAKATKVAKAARPDMAAKVDKTDKAAKPARRAPVRAEPQDDDGAMDPQQRAQWKAACQALTVVLSKHPSARNVFRQLTMLENTLQDRGPKVLPKLPLDLLEGALKQLETLVTDWSARDLAFLRSQISVVVRDRQRVERVEANELSVLVTPERLQVREATDSVYLEFQDHFTASRTGDALRV